jgi:hypothetical protein
MPHDKAIERLKRHDQNFDEKATFIGMLNVWSNLRQHESIALFGKQHGLEVEPLTNITDDLQRRRAELLKQARLSSSESVRQACDLQSGFLSMVGDNTWLGIVFWVNFIAELKVPGRDGPPNAATVERPEWNATLADVCTFIRPIGVVSPPRSADLFANPLTWMLHDITPDPSAARRLPPDFRAPDLAA